MELPENFLKYNYIIDVIREFIDRDYLLTKKSQLKWYCINVFNVSPYTSKYGILDNYDQYLTNEYYDNYHDRTHYDTDKCIRSRKDDYTGENIEEPFLLTEKDVFNLLKDITWRLDIAEILFCMIFPPHSNIETLIQKQYGKNIYPLDKSLLLEFASFKFVNQFKHQFINIPLIKNIDKDFIIVKNNVNDVIIEIPKNLFDIYCGISLSITMFKEQ